MKVILINRFFSPIPIVYSCFEDVLKKTKNKFAFICRKENRK